MGAGRLLRFLPLRAPFLAHFGPFSLFGRNKSPKSVLSPQAVYWNEKCEIRPSETTRAEQRRSCRFRNLLERDGNFILNESQITQARGQTSLLLAKGLSLSSLRAALRRKDRAREFT